MTFEEAQQELLKILRGGSGASSAVSSFGGLATLAGVPSAQGGLLSQVLQGGTAGGGSGSVLSSVLGSVVSGETPASSSLLGLSPILAGLRALFGGGATRPALPELVRYAAPDPVSLDLGVGAAGRELSAVSYGQGGPRLAPAISSITVNVNAMDSRSFSDNSEMIAQAVREAMLNSGALTDVVGEL